MSNARVTTVLILLLVAAAQTAAARQLDAPPTYRLSLPGKGWALDLTIPRTAALDLPSLAATPQEFLSPEGRVYSLTFFPDTSQKSRKKFVFLDISLMPAQADGGPEEARAFTLKQLSKSGGTVNALKTWDYKQFAVARYKFGVELRGDPLSFGYTPISFGDLRNAQAFLVKDDVWISLRLVAADLGGREESLFNSLLDSLKLTDTSAPSSSFDYYHKGHLLYLRKDYREAAVALATALELERRERRLDATTWRGLVSNLIDSYGASGDVAGAKEVMDYGAQADPAYAPFQLALARYYARRGDLDNVIAHLEKAAPLLKDDRFALRRYDPAQDPAFEKFRKDERFRKALKELKK
jgi:tetratricopeptide (TPR) repeat protein